MQITTQTGILNYYCLLGERNLHPIIWNFDRYDFNSNKLISKINELSLNKQVFIRNSYEDNLGLFLSVEDLYLFMNNYPSSTIFSISKPIKWHKLYIGVFRNNKLYGIYKNKTKDHTDIEKRRKISGNRITKFFESVPTRWCPLSELLCIVCLTYKGEYKVLGFKSITSKS